MAAPCRRLALLQGHLRPTKYADNAPSSCDGALAAAPCRATTPAAAAAQGPPVLVGGMVLDLQAHPSGPADVARGGSVPGRVSQSPGGVARNVAEALTRLLASAGCPPARLPLLVSAVGDDLAGRTLLAAWEALGASTACIARVPGGATPAVSVVFDLSGEVAACVADVGLLEAALGVQHLRQARVEAALAAAPVLMLDGNLAPAALEEACRQAAAARVPVWFEPVSVPKSVRATALLPLLAFVSPNEKELAAMAAAARQQQQQQQRQQQQSVQRRPSSGGSSSIASSASSRSSDIGVPAAGGQAAAVEGAAPGDCPAALRGLLPDVATLLLAGVRHIALTLGADGAALCTLALGRQSITVCHMPALPATVVNCSGAGDCLVAGCLFALSRGLAAEAALAHGIATAHAAVQSQTNVPAGLDAAAVARRAAAAAARRQIVQLPLPAQ